MDTMTEPRLIPHKDTDPLCDWCDKSVPVSRAEARLIRLLFGPVFCEECSPANNYQHALNDIRSDIRAHQGDDINEPDESGEPGEPEEI